MNTPSKTWLITGASSGFGRALAEHVLRQGDKVALVARRHALLESIAALAPERALAQAEDITSAGAPARIVRNAIERFGSIDVLANVAGRGSLGAVEEFSAAQLRQQFDLNFFAAVEMTRAVLPQMRAQRSGHVLNLTSIGGIVSIGGFGPYCATKFALEAWSEALADEVSNLGIRVTIVEPGNFRTEFAGDANMRPDCPVPAYRELVEPIRAFLYDQNGKQAGDPAKAAAIMSSAVESADPPRRLMLGPDAFDLWDRTIAARIKDIDSWRAVGMTTSYDDAEMITIPS